MAKRYYVTRIIKGLKQEKEIDYKQFYDILLDIYDSEDYQKILMYINMFNYIIIKNNNYTLEIRNEEEKAPIN